jgi:hypothetical protein
MRTKTLLLAAVLGVATVVSSLAQVYSVNVVGYVNKQLVPGFNLIANPLDNKAANGNTISNLFAGMAEGTTVYKYSGGMFSANGFEFGEWANPNQTLEPGEGAFVFVPGAANVTVTFVGDVRQGTLTTPLLKGFTLASSQVPQAGGIQAALGFVPAEGDTVYSWDTTVTPATYRTRSYEFGAWSEEPVLAIAEAVFISVPADKSWVRTFTVQ